MKKGIIIVTITLIMLSAGLIKAKASNYDSWYVENFYNNSSTPMPHNAEFWAYSYIFSNARTNDIWFNSSRTDAGKGVSVLSKTNEVIFNFLIQIPGASVYDCDVISSTAQLNGVWNNTTTGEGGAISPIIYKYNNISCDHESNTFSFVLRQVKDNGTSVGVPCSVNNVNINEEHMYVTATCPIMQHVTDLSRMTIFAYQDTQPQGGIKYNINHTLILNYDSTANVTDAINGQTQQQHQDHEDFMEENHTYSDDPSRDINGTNELNDYSQKEDQLMNSLDLNMSLMDQISINPNASVFIWGIVDRLRQINPAIILLMTSILGMGLIKMVLNR